MAPVAHDGYKLGHMAHDGYQLVLMSPEESQLIILLMMGINES